MGKIIAEHIMRYRKRLKVTQDQLASEFNVTGPAIFKFEKGYVLPSLRLWLKLAERIGIERRQAVLMWAKDKLPDKFQDFILLEGNKGPKRSGFAQHKTTAKLRAAIAKDKWLPSGLTDLAKSNALWAMYKPTGKEIDLLRDIFSKLGEGTDRDFRDGLRIVREFRGKKS
jgi:DNA-binding XRE family transcriptional regulator